MIAGLHWTAWFLLALAVFPGLGLSYLFFRAHRGPAARAGDDEPHVLVRED